ncbi:MAG: nucleoside permease [Prolixibacteraceae bacterium]|nr:nucleoside permease [Prolixibacteraceae bacterium]MBT6999467.1 nucleoside permease [Prolixibacteraceae bacterium]MBT7396839.1 nucleoside permease [Prolixibacteraceae bacterium]
MKTKTYLSLSFMMFLEFFIWGVWFVGAGNYLSTLGFQGEEIGRAMSTLAWGSIIAAFFVSLIADKYFAAQKLNGILHLIAGILMFIVAQITDPTLLFWVLLLYMICYMPTIALANTIALHHTPNAGKQFPRIRVLGTIGWVFGGILISFLDLEVGPIPMIMAAGASILLGVFSFFLPNTPPQKKDSKIKFKDIIGLDALKLMKDRSFAILIVATLLISIPFAMYFQYINMSMNEAGIKNVTGLMSMGQMSEVIFMLLMPLFFVRLGIKRMLLMGMFAWVIRYVLFAFGNDAELISFFYIGIILHGICYDFFYVTAQIYVDKKAPLNLRASLQGLLTFITYGVGWLIGTNLSGWELQRSQIMEGNQVVGHNWQSVMLVPAALALIIAILFIIFFKDEKEKIKADIETII